MPKMPPVGPGQKASMAGTGVPLAFVPLGTANVMAIEMGLPRGIEAACRVALYGESRPVALAEAHGRYFLMMAGIGFDAAAVRAVSSRLKRKTGKLAYVVAGVRAWLQNCSEPLRLQGESGEPVQAWHVIISNIRHYGGRFHLAPQNGLEQPLLTACLVEHAGRLALLLFWLRIALRGYLLGPIRRMDAREFSVYGVPTPMQIDGDDSGDTPAGQSLKIRCHTDLLCLVFPSENPTKE
jgi:diacylglycerol kinase family enzyme